MAGRPARPAGLRRQGQPQQNCYIERFNGSMRRELLNGEQFHSVLEAKVVIEDWLVLYNTRRAHRGLGDRTPAGYAKMARSQHADDRTGGVVESAYHHQNWTSRNPVPTTLRQPENPTRLSHDLDQSQGAAQ